MSRHWDQLKHIMDILLDLRKNKDKLTISCRLKLLGIYPISPPIYKLYLYNPYQKICDLTQDSFADTPYEKKNSFTPSHGTFGTPSTKFFCLNQKKLFTNPS